ncbi:hypothetical protein [Lactococcus kimchii]|uniref:hypothetical protein n=1 Tax=Lactococcus sp. S-13 TaxID=2507158 RepID=UPI001022BA18|nr:hypothetical protein [Lactococcus sp. S-13]RZI47884.1 hypothetical protein EQJ87_10705 [Lactococcus sp. S-13]
MKSLIHDKYNLRYFIPIVLCIIIMIGFLSSGVIKKKMEPVVTTSLGRVLNIENKTSKIIFERADYYKKSNLLVTGFYLKSDEVVPTDTIKIETINGRTQQRIEASVEKINANYYVVFIPNISPNFKQIINNITLKDNQKQSYSVGGIAVTPKNVSKNNTSYQAKPLDFYVGQYKEYARQDVEEKIKEYDKDIAKFNAQIKALNKENQLYLADMDLKTSDQQKEIFSQIQSNNNSISGINSQIKTVKDNQKKVEEQRNILSQ